MESVRWFGRFQLFRGLTGDGPLRICDTCSEYERHAAYVYRTSRRGGMYGLLNDTLVTACCSALDVVAAWHIDLLAAFGGSGVQGALSTTARTVKGRQVWYQ